MSLYNHRMTLVVPESLMPQANQLALIAGESPDDVNTFTTSSYQDNAGNIYAVCSTVIKPIVLQMLGQSLSDVNAPLSSELADVNSAQAAMDASVLYADGMIATPDHIYIAIDIDPHEFFELVGLVGFESNTLI